jgi:hypothetical protein
MHRNISFLSLFLLLFATTSSSQLIINFNAAIYGQTLDGLSNVQITNSSHEDVRAKISIHVREMGNGNVLSAVIPFVLLRQGINNIDRNSFSTGRLQFSNNYYGTTLSQSGKLPEGDYEYCFQVEITDSKANWPNSFFENCFDLQLQPMTPLMLIDPVDGEESCNTRPDFLWQLPMPFPQNAKCRLVLCEVSEKQDLAEAINYNLPIISQGNIAGNQLRFPGNIPELQREKLYAWQVILYSDKTILKTSEIWSYKVKCGENKVLPNTDSYRELKETDDGNFYIANQVLRFSFNNPYNNGKLEYTITKVTDPQTAIKDLPSLKLLTGLNKFDIDLSENKSFINGNEYLLTVTLINNRKLTLRFIYKSNN